MTFKVKTRGEDMGGFHPDPKPEPTFKKKLDPDPTSEKKTRFGPGSGSATLHNSTQSVKKT